MSYGKHAQTHTYNPTKKVKPIRQTVTVSHHQSFRQEWDSNFDKAVAQAQALQKEGYLVEEGLRRGAMLERQAYTLTRRLQDTGYETQTIPVATWQGEKVVFVVYKPPKEAVPPPPPKPTRKPKIEQKLTPEQLAQMFEKVVFTAKDDPTNEIDRFKREGWMMDPHRIIAFISKDAPATGGSDSLIGMARELKQGNPLASFAKAMDLTKALRAAKATKQYVNVQVGPDMAVSIDNLRNATKTFGYAPIGIYCKGKEKPIYVMDLDGNAVAIAPVIEPNPSATIDIQTLMKDYSS
jgi:hypothetical protein